MFTNLKIVGSIIHRLTKYVIFTFTGKFAYSKESGKPEEGGGWMIQRLKKVYENYWVNNPETDLLTILTKVNFEMAKMETSTDNENTSGLKTVGSIIHKLTKDVILSPVMKKQ